MILKRASKAKIKFLHIPSPHQANSVFDIYKSMCEVLLVTGLRSRYVTDTEVIHKEMAPGMCSMIKVRKSIFKTITVNKVLITKKRLKS